MSKRKQRLFTLPTKQYKTRVQFEEPITCNLRLSINGIRKDEATEEQLKQANTDHCFHPQWPPFMPQCIGCLAHNKFERYMEDSKGNKHRILEKNNQEDFQAVLTKAEEIAKLKDAKE